LAPFLYNIGDGMELSDVSRGPVQVKAEGFAEEGDRVRIFHQNFSHGKARCVGFQEKWFREVE